jgi:HD-GYP domain-containing protein (c-di-GMP phosphodiesterase class II)
MSEIRSSGHSEIQPAAFQMGSAVLELAESPDILSLLAQGKTESSYIPHHMVNVGVLSVLLGKWLRLSSESLAELAVAGVLHDVGMASLPPHILSKPGGLTEGEYALVKTHPTLGHEIVASELGADSIPALACLEHHERTNGSGYPRGLKADETRMTSRIVAVADVYDAMSSKRSYHSRHPEFWVLSQLQENGFDILDPTVTRAMVDHLAQSIHGHRVRLNNGQIGRIVFVNDQDPSRPVVEVGPALIDLSTRPDLALVSEVED